MYPTVCTLMKLWAFIIGEGYQADDATDWARTGVPRATLAKVVRGEPAMTKVPQYVITQRLRELWFRRGAELDVRQAQLAHWKAVVEAEGGIRPAARKLGLDASNLAKALRNAG